MAPFYPARQDFVIMEMGGGSTQLGVFRRLKTWGQKCNDPADQCQPNAVDPKTNANVTIVCRGLRTYTKEGPKVEKYCLQNQSSAHYRPGVTDSCYHSSECQAQEDC